MSQNLIYMAIWPHIKDQPSYTYVDFPSRAYFPKYYGEKMEFRAKTYYNSQARQKEMVGGQTNNHNSKYATNLPTTYTSPRQNRTEAKVDIFKNLRST